MMFNLLELLPTTTDLSGIEVDFSKDEIDDVISQLPRNKSPGPYGFNNEFTKAVGHSLQMTSMISLRIFSMAIFV